MKNLVLCFAAIVLFAFGCGFPSGANDEQYPEPARIAQRSLTSDEVAMVESFDIVIANNYDAIGLATEVQIDSVEYGLLSLTQLLEQLGIDTQEYKENADVLPTKILDVLEVNDIEHITTLLQNSEVNYLTNEGEYPPVLAYGMPCTTEYHLAYIQSWGVLMDELHAVIQGLENGITDFVENIINAVWRHGVRIGKAYAKWRDCMML